MFKVWLDRLRLSYALFEDRELFGAAESEGAQSMALALIERGAHEAAARGMKAMLRLCGSRNAGDYNASITLLNLARALKGAGGAENLREASRLFKRLLSMGEAVWSSEELAAFRTAVANCEADAHCGMSDMS